MRLAAQTSTEEGGGARPRNKQPLVTHIFKIRHRQLVSFSHWTSSSVRVDSATRLTSVSQIGHGNVLRRDSSRSTHEVQLRGWVWDVGLRVSER